MAGNKEVKDAIEQGVIFHKSSQAHQGSGTGKVKTKAKKKQYITGLHGSASAKRKAMFREQRANRHK